MPNHRDHPEYDEDAWQRVGQALTERMAELGLTQSDLIRRSDVSNMTIRPLQNGEPGNYRDATLSKVAKALGWRHNAIQQILEGHDPHDLIVGDFAITLGDPPPRERRRSYDERINALPEPARRMIDGMIEIAERELRDAGGMAVSG